MLNKHIYCWCLILFSVFGFSQNKEKDSALVVNSNEIKLDTTLENREVINPLSPSKAAFYSAVLPGLGQAYNKKYWKIPIVYAAIGTGVYFYIYNNDELNRYRDAYKRRLAGYTDDEFYGKVSDDGLRRAQDQFRRNQELSLLITIGLYVLNIIDANVDAHLLQYNVDENLAIKPHFQYNEMENSSDLGLTVNFKF